MMLGISSAMPMVAFAQTFSYNFNNFKIDYIVSGSWADNQNIMVTLTNTGTEPIRNWALQYEPHGTITGLWNGEVHSENIVKSVMHNSDIAAGGSVTFGYTLTGVTGTPDNFALCSHRVIKESGFTVDIAVIQDWGSGFMGAITLTNTTNAPVMAWELSFHANFNITSPGNFIILENEGEHYRIMSEHNGNIHPNSSISLQFNGDSVQSLSLSNILLTEVIVSTSPIIPDPNDNCTRFGGIIEPALGGFGNFINGNAADLNSRASLEIDVLDLIAGTSVKADEIHGFEVITWGPNTENRQVTIEVNNIASPRFHGSSSAHPDRIWAIMSHGDTPDNGGRTEQNSLRYMNIYGGSPKTASNTVPLTSFVNSAMPDRFDVRIRAHDNHTSLVTAIALLDEYGQILGFTTYSTQDENGTWSQLMSLALCLCDDCSDIPVFYHISAEAVYNCLNENVLISWTASEPEGIFELFYSSFEDDEFYSIGLFEDEFEFVHETGAADFIVHYYKVVQIIDDEIAAESNICYAIWTPHGVDWTEYIRTWEFDADDDIFAVINTDDNAFKLSLEFEAAGIPDLYLRVVESGYSPAMQNDMMIGVIPELIYPEDFSVESVTLKFEIADEHLDNVLNIFTDHPEFEGIKRLNVFKWFDEINMSLPIETKFDIGNSILYTEVDSLGTFCIMDMEMWFNFLGVEAEEQNEQGNGFAPAMMGFEPASAPLSNVMPPLPDEYHEGKYVYIDLINGRYRMFISANRPIATNIATRTIGIVNPFNIYTWEPAINDFWTVSVRNGNGSSTFANSNVIYSNFDIFNPQGTLFYQNSIEAFYSHVKNNFPHINICGVDNFECHKFDCILCNTDPICGVDNFVCNEADCSLCNPEADRIDIIFVLQGAGNNPVGFNTQKQFLIQFGQQALSSFPNLNIRVLHCFADNAYFDTGWLADTGSFAGAVGGMTYTVTSQNPLIFGNAYSTALNLSSYRPDSKRFSIALQNSSNGSFPGLFGSTDPSLTELCITTPLNSLPDSRSNVYFGRWNITEITVFNNRMPEFLIGFVANHSGIPPITNDPEPVCGVDNFVCNEADCTLCKPETVLEIWSVIIGTGWKEIDLAGPLNAYNGIDTDEDGITDWNEVYTQHPLMILSSCENYIKEIPTIQDCLDHVGALRGYPDYIVNAFEAERRKYGNMAKHFPVLLIHSDPTEKYTTNDGLSDFDSPKPLRYFSGPIGWDVWGAIDGEEWMRIRGINEMVFLGEHLAFDDWRNPLTWPFIPIEYNKQHTSVIIFIAPGHELYNDERFESSNRILWENTLYATIGGTASIFNPYLQGTTKSPTDRDLDTKTSMQFVRPHTLWSDVKPSNVAKDLFDSSSHFTSFHGLSFPYSAAIINNLIVLYPGSFFAGTGYNSNSFTRSLLNANGIFIRPQGSAPGWDIVIERSYFNR
jgi:hypothetical protein